MPVLAPFPIVLEAATWDELKGLAEALAAETLEAERVLDQQREGRRCTWRRSLRHEVQSGGEAVGNSNCTPDVFWPAITLTSFARFHGSASLFNATWGEMLSSLS